MRCELEWVVVLLLLLLLIALIAPVLLVRARVCVHSGLSAICAF